MLKYIMPKYHQFVIKKHCFLCSVLLPCQMLDWEILLTLFSIFVGWTLWPCHVSICTRSFLIRFGEIRYYWICDSVWSSNCQKGLRNQWWRRCLRGWAFHWIGFPCWYSYWIQFCWHFTNFGGFEWCSYYWYKKDNRWRSPLGNYLYCICF